jgi:hypothetical protein
MKTVIENVQIRNWGMFFSPDFGRSNEPGLPCSVTGPGWFNTTMKKNVEFVILNGVQMGSNRNSSI